MQYTYAAVFTPEKGGLYSVLFPDFQCCSTCGDNLPDAINMAQDALCLTLYDMEQDGTPIPKASRPQDLETSGDQFASVIAVDTEVYRRFYEKKAVKKTLTIPSWLNEQAERANLNFSHTLQKALKVELHIED